MTSKIATSIAKRFGENKAKAFEPPNPRYEVYIDDRGRERKRKRPLPPGLTKEEGKLLQSIRRRGYYLDKGFHICGMRFGWTFIIGLIPVVGDLSNAALGYNLVIRKCKTADIPDSLLRQMQLNTLLATGMGFVPLLGDIIMAVYKPNSRNSNLFEAWLVEKTANRSPADIEAQGQHVVNKAKAGKWSKNTGTNDAFLASPVPARSEAGIASTSTATERTPLTSSPAIPPRL